MVPPLDLDMERAPRPLLDGDDRSAAEAKVTQPVQLNYTGILAFLGKKFIKCLYCKLVFGLLSFLGFGTWLAKSSPAGYSQQLFLKTVELQNLKNLSA